VAGVAALEQQLRVRAARAYEALRPSWLVEAPNPVLTDVRQLVEGLASPPSA
jgi:hypothetical protein